jgi:hypothetical protein
MIKQRAHDVHYTYLIIVNAARDRHFLLLEFLWNNVANFLQARNKYFPSPLHAAIREQNVTIVKWLIEHGADCNTRHSDVQTLLFYAVTERSLDVVRAVVEVEGGASVDVLLLEEVEEYISLLRYNRPPWKYRVKSVKKILKYLEQKA